MKDSTSTGPGDTVYRDHHGQHATAEHLRRGRGPRDSGDGPPPLAVGLGGIPCHEMGDFPPPRSGGLSLDLEENKSPEGERQLLDPDQDVMVIPEQSGGKLDPYGGTGKRIADLRKFEALVHTMRRPVMLTLTLDRGRFETPEQAFNEVMPKLSRLLSERLGVSVWGRVVEVQTATGDGWIHWHILLELAGTRFEVRRGFADLAAFNAAVRRSWCERWQISQPAGVDTQLVRSKAGIVGYIAKYLVKPWPAIPVWIGERRLFRLVGFSKAANERLRAVGLLDPRREARRKRSRRKRPLASIFRRCAASGLTCKVLLAGRYLGRLSGRVEDVMAGIGSGAIPGLIKTRVFVGARSRTEKAVAVLKQASRGAIEQVDAWLVAQGFTEQCETQYRHRLYDLEQGWERMQTYSPPTALPQHN